MPPPGGSKRKKGRAPKHQNTFAFRHNPNSKKTDKILSSPNVGVCRRCRDKIEWRKRYRKYKPRTQPGKCNMCSRKNVLEAYHTICGKCAVSDGAVAVMEKRQGGGGGGGSSAAAATAPTLPTGECEPAASPEDDNDLVDGSGINGGMILATGPIPANTVDTTLRKSKRRIRVCAVCAAEPALSKYSNASKEDGDIIEQIHELEDTLEAGVDNDDGHTLTLREMKRVGRKVEKLQVELKERLKRRKHMQEGVRGGRADEAGNHKREGNHGGEHDSVNSGGADMYDEADDPFLVATEGKALVGEEYQNMILVAEHAN